MTFLNQITIKTDVEKDKFFRYGLKYYYTSHNMEVKIKVGLMDVLYIQETDALP